jgi:hypothetical protein
MKVTVIYVGTDVERLIETEVEEGATVEAAISASGLLVHEPGLASCELTVGIWNRTVSLGHLVADGDRIEVYRPLVVDPKQARRLRAELGRRGRR